MADKQPIIDWEPAPGCVLVKPVKREELAALYNQSGGSTLSLPDKVGKVSDSVGVGKVVKKGLPGYTEIDALLKVTEATSAGAEFKDAKVYNYDFTVGDYVAFMPYTDLLIEIDGVKYALIEYKNIRAVRKGQ